MDHHCATEVALTNDRPVFTHSHRRARPRLAPLLWVCAVLLATSCQTPPPPAPPAAPVTPPEPAPEPPPAPLSAAARTLLDSADRQIVRRQLSTPPGDNALATDARVLAIDPGVAAVAEVRRGRERVVEAYLGLAAAQLTTDANPARTAAARRYTERAAIVDPGHPSVTAMRQRIALIGSSPRRRVVLDAAALAARGRAIQQQLRTIGAEAKAKRAFVTIFARDDAEGRWIYAQLSDAPGDVRVRAEFRRSASAELQLLYVGAPCKGC